MADTAQRPSIGRIVHFYATWLEDFQPNGNGPYAAIVTRVHSDNCVDLQPFGAPGAREVQSSVVEKASAQGASAWWEWPPRT